jgi:ABC-type bacteriocin/lantibiotic exporter with double-glycine peptidase domain
VSLGPKFADFVGQIVKALACTIFALVTAPKFTVVFFALIPFTVLSIAMVIVNIKKYTIKEIKAYSVAGKLAQEALSSIRTVLAFGLERKFSQNYENNLKEAERMSIKKGLLAGIFGGLGYALNYCFFGVAVIYGVYLLNNDCKMKPGNIIQSLFSMFNSTMALSQAFPFIKDLAESKAVAKKIFAQIKLKSLIDVFDKEKMLHGAKLAKLTGNIEFQNVKFSYPQRKDLKILKGLSFNFEAGKTVAICGSR